MPCWGFLPVPAGGIGWPDCSTPCRFPWWKSVAGGGFSRSSTNKPAVMPGRRPDLEVLPLLVLSSPCHHGGGKREEDGWIWSAMFWQESSFFIDCVSVRCPLPLFFVLVAREEPAMPGKCSRPRCRNRIPALVPRDEALLAVDKALGGEGLCRLDFLCCRCEEDDEMCVGHTAGVEGDALRGLCCVLLFFRGLSAKFSCVVRVLPGLCCFFGCVGVLYVKSGRVGFQVFRLRSGVCFAVFVPV